MKTLAEQWAEFERYGLPQSMKPEDRTFLRWGFYVGALNVLTEQYRSRGTVEIQRREMEILITWFDELEVFSQNVSPE